MRSFCRLFALTVGVLLGGSTCPALGQSVRIFSPDGRIAVSITTANGVPHYAVTVDGRDVLLPSRLGFRFEDAAPLDRDLVLIDTERRAVDETWTQPWGEAKTVRNHYNELRLTFADRATPARRLVVVFRAFDDGIGFRYVLPSQGTPAPFRITDEVTEFTLPGDPTAWWIPAYQDTRYEYLYRQSPVSALDTVHTPLTLKAADDLYLSIHEANLTDYAAMTLAADGTTLKADLVPWSDGIKVKGSTPHVSPWRTVQIASTPGGLITSHLILNLNEPNALGDVSWVEPGKYVGIWWGMHLGANTWHPGPTHGATTARTKAYIDFAAAHGFSGVLVEGWNVGWENDWVCGTDVFDYTTPYEDFDLDSLSGYARAKGVGLIGHHETGGDVVNYERQLDDAFAYYRAHGITTVKTGYVCGGRNVRRVDGDGVVHREWHHGQFMVRHYRHVVETAARYHLMLDVHEPIKDTGLRRTYPNMMTREGARGQEFNAWSQDGGNPPEHTTILPFTRLLAGPMDFTPGIFDLLFDTYRPDNRVNSTLANQLALYVVIYSPLQMAADLPENYAGHPAFQFIEDVPVDWEETRVLNGEIGDYVTIARKDRNSTDWYLGSVTDEEARVLEVPLTFLSDTTYVAEIYADAPDAHWETNPLAYEMSRVLVSPETVLHVRLAAGGGQAVRLRMATNEDRETLPPYRHWH